MKIRIGNLLDRTAQTLLLAGSLAVPPAVLAQPAPSPSLEKPISLSHGPNEVKPVPQPARDPHLIAMKVELAWLADPVTSCCRLEARTLGSTLEVHGQAPSQPALAHALELARAESGMHVVSKAQLNTGLKAPGSGKPQDVLHREAFSALRQRFPERAPSISIRTLADGELVVNGTVPTYEEKLAISRHLRQTTSCRCILNQLQVLADAHESLTPNNPRAASATLLAPEALKPQPVQPVGHTLDPDAAAKAPSSAAPHASADTKQAGGPPSGKVSGADTKESSSSKSADRAQTPSPAAAPRSPVATPAQPAAKPMVYPTKWRRMAPGEVAMSSRGVLPVAPSTETATPVQEKLATPPKPQTHPQQLPTPTGHKAVASVDTKVSKAETPPPPKRGLPVELNPPEKAVSSVETKVSKAEPPAPPKRALPVESNPTAPVIATVEVPPAAPENVVIPAVQASPAPVPPAQPKALTVARKEPYVTDGLILIESMVKPAAPSVPAMGQKPSPIVRTGSYVTTGVILFSDPATEKGPPKDPPLAALQTRLQQRIATVCGKSNKDIEVTAVSETTIAVRIKANSTLEGEELSNRIFQLPELGPCQVSLDVLVIK